MVNSKAQTFLSNSGSPGGGMSFRLRGITSLSGFNQPLIIMDGVYLDNSSISPGLNTVSQAAGGGSQSNQDNASNRLADINPEDIENIEILKRCLGSSDLWFTRFRWCDHHHNEKGKKEDHRLRFHKPWVLRLFLIHSAHVHGIQKKWKLLMAQLRFPSTKPRETPGKFMTMKTSSYGNKGLLGQHQPFHYRWKREDKIFYRWHPTKTMKGSSRTPATRKFLPSEYRSENWRIP